MKAIVRLYRTAKGWRWQVRDGRNGKIIGASTESYVRRRDAMNNTRRLKNVLNGFNLDSANYRGAVARTIHA